MSSPVSNGTGVCDSRNTRQTLVIQPTINDFRDCRRATTRVRVRVEKLTPHRRQKNEVIREAEILLRDLQLGHHLRPWHHAEERMKRLPRLEVDWSILYLQQHIRRKLSVERLQIFVSRAAAVVTRLLVVDKRAPHDDSMMRRNGSREHVCAVGMRAIVSSWSRLAFAVCFDEKPAEVGNQLVDLIRLLLPPLNHGPVEWIGSWEMIQLHRR